MSMCECTPSIQPLHQTGNSPGADCHPSCPLPVPRVHCHQATCNHSLSSASKHWENSPQVLCMGSPHWTHYSQAREGACGILGGWWPGGPDGPELPEASLYSVSQQNGGSEQPFHQSQSGKRDGWSPMGANGKSGSGRQGQVTLPLHQPFLSPNSPWRSLRPELKLPFVTLHAPGY